MAKHVILNIPEFRCDNAGNSLRKTKKTRMMKRRREWKICRIGEDGIFLENVRQNLEPNDQAEYNSELANAHPKRLNNDARRFDNNSIKSVYSSPTSLDGPTSSVTLSISLKR